MNSEDQEPVERLEETLFHPADKTFNSLHDQALRTKKELTDERHELNRLLKILPSPPPKAGTTEHEAYLKVQQQIQELKEMVAKTHDELMEILKKEEKISRDIQEGN